MAIVAEFFTSDLSSFVNGQHSLVNGGTLTFVGTVTVSGYVNPDDLKYTPDKIAALFRDLHINRNTVELVY